MKLEAGENFTKDAVAAAGICDIRVAVRADDNLLGGMTYRLDPELTRPQRAARRLAARLRASGEGAPRLSRHRGPGRQGGQGKGDNRRVQDARRRLLIAQCRQENPPTNRYCGSCGAPLTSSEQLATRQEHRPVPAARAWPAKLGPVSKALAVGVAAHRSRPLMVTAQDRAEDRSSRPAVRGVGSASRSYLVGQSLEEVLPPGVGGFPASSSRGERSYRTSRRGQPVGEGRTPSLPLDRPIAPIEPRCGCKSAWTSLRSDRRPTDHEARASDQHDCADREGIR